jgi:hypothetical protein
LWTISANLSDLANPIDAAGLYNITLMLENNYALTYYNITLNLTVYGFVDHAPHFAEPLPVELHFNLSDIEDRPVALMKSMYTSPFVIAERGDYIIEVEVWDREF